VDGCVVNPACVFRVSLDVTMKYIYRCNQCNYEFEKDLTFNQSINAAKPPKFPCPQCNGKTRRLINIPAIHYRGSGFTKSIGEKK